MGNSQNKRVETNACKIPLRTSSATAQTTNFTLRSTTTTVRLAKTASKPKVLPTRAAIWPTNTTIQSTNTSIISSIKPPRPFLTEEEFFQTWLLWKNDFLIYRKILNDEKPNHGKWGDMLLNIMGPFGQQIYNTFRFSSLESKKDIDVILNKFDQYYVFETKKKQAREDTYMYIYELQLTAKERNIENEEVIKKKIFKEIDEHMFTKAAKKVLPSFQFSSDSNNLSLKEIAFIWKLYDQNGAQNCDRCGNNHNKTCSALGKQCFKCNELNHFQQRCPSIFIIDCLYCGDAHFKKQCPAYNEVCTKCKKLNHFSWKCQSAQVRQCQFCGLTHVAVRSFCPAKDTVCIFCKTTGHFASKCKKKAYSQNH